MKLDVVKRRIELLLASEKRWPVVVDFSNRSDLVEFSEHFSVVGNTILSAEKFCGKDGTFKLEEVVNAIENNQGNTFIESISAFLKIQGESFSKSTLKALLSKSVNGHVVLLTYQCRNYLKFNDSRFADRNQIMLVDGEADTIPEICLVSPQLASVFSECYQGFEKIGTAIEKSNNQTVYIATDVKGSSFDKSVLNLSKINNGYDILCTKDSRTKSMSSSFGTHEQWIETLKLMGSGNWTTVIESQFGSLYGLADCIHEYESYSDFKKWLFFIAITLFGTKKNTYLQYAVNNSAKYKELTKSLYRAILAFDQSSLEFPKLYSERKAILASFVDSLAEVVDYCKVLSIKEENAVYFLTDLTQPEKEKVIDWLDTYGEKYSAPQLIGILSSIYPNLADYLAKYRFRNELLDTYFDVYKYQKVINKILPSFEVIVDEQSRELGFINALNSRSSIIDKLDLKETHAYFFDALGVEYLGFIQAKCNQYGLSTNISCGRSELPSLTQYNKEFLKTFEDSGCAVTNIKSLDDIKHHGEDSFDYEKVKKPVYLITELEIIDDLLKKIRAKIYGGHYKKALIVSDHGASRLAVLHDSENLWRMATNGVHSGRCCPKNDIDSKPDHAIDAEGFWVLSNYDRFQGGRKANVEVHGGASIEEVSVPIIEITRKRSNVEVFVTDASKIVTLAAKEFPKIKIFVGVHSNCIVIKIGDHFYDANQTIEEFIYEVPLYDCTKKGIYYFDVIDGSDTLATNLSFEVKKKGMSEVSLFD